MIAAGWDRFRLFNIGDLLIHRGRSLMSLIVMAVSAALLVAVFSISGSVTGSVDKLVAGLGGEAQLEISGITDAGFGQDLLGAVSATPGVQTAVPMLRAQTGADADRALLVGADARIAELGSSLTGSLGADAAKLLTVPNGVLTGAAMGYREGETFPLGSGTATVAGILDTDGAGQLNGGYLIATTLATAQKLTGRTGQLDSIQIIAEPGTDIERLRTALTDTVAGRAVVADPGLRAAQAGGAVMIIRYSTLMAAAAALVVSAFLIYNAMAMAIAQRRPTLSLLRAIGGRRAPMVRDLLAEAVLVGILGGILGAGAGILMGRIAIDRLPAAILQSVEARTEYQLPGYAVPVAIALCVLASVTASAFAARSVYRVQPIEALVPVGAAAADTVRPAWRWAAVLLGLFMVGAAIYLAETDFGIWSLASISLSFGAAIVLCFAATGPIVRTAGAIARLFGGPGALGATTLERAPRRVWATAMTVLIGVAAVVSTGSATRNVVDSAGASFENLAATDFWVTPGSMAQFPTGPLLPDGLEERLEALPGVAAVNPAQLAFASVGAGRVLLQGFPSGSDNTRLSSEISPETARLLVTGHGVVVSRDVARSLRVTAGDTLTLPTPTGRHEVRVLQVIPYFSAIAGVIMMDLDRMRGWYQRPGETTLAVDLAPGTDPETVRAELRRAVPPELYIDSGREAVAATSASLRQGTALATNILWIVVLVATIALLNTLMLSVLDRRREIGVLRAMGTSRRFLLRSVLAEAAGIGLIGAVLGLLVGAAVQYLSAIAIGHAMTIDVVYEPSPLLVVYGVVALLLALLGSVPPALRAARMPIVEALAVD
ncbi:ABC transporter permease [Nocardia carnea]|uniref:ABC transporter permease n=1 Tax=Nocardia carnea TaxID=37328 RepID=UPI0024565F18|nr:FtsX-like permease family protein [Nocardia carnea]